MSGEKLSWGKTCMWKNSRGVRLGRKHLEDRGTHREGRDVETDPDGGRDGHRWGGGDGAHLVSWTFWGCVTSSDRGGKDKSPTPRKAARGQALGMSARGVLEPGWGL